jgi:hypothetical protein
MANRPAQALERRRAGSAVAFPTSWAACRPRARSRAADRHRQEICAHYRLEVVGDEDVETPAGTFKLPAPARSGRGDDRTLAGLRACAAAGEDPAYRPQGRLYVQVATAIEFSQEPLTACAPVSLPPFSPCRSAALRTVALGLSRRPGGCRLFPPASRTRPCRPRLRRRTGVRRAAPQTLAVGALRR